MTPNFYPTWGNVEAPPIEMAECFLHDLSLRARRDEDRLYVFRCCADMLEERISDAKFFALEQMMRKP